jgi:ABC-type transport system involved in multi-copper enzyme maturation permease subunit
MPVHERGYTRWQPSGLRADPPWWVIARRGLAAPLRKRSNLGLLVLAWIPALVMGVQVYTKVKAGQLAELAAGVGWGDISAGGFLTFIDRQDFFVFLVIAILGAGLIARDRQDNGLSLYFSRPLSLTDYLAGKTLVILGGYLAVTLVPALLLCLFAYLVEPTAVGLELLIVTPLRLTVLTLVTGTALSLIMLAFSSLGTRTVLVIVWWAVLCLGGDAVGNIGENVGASVLQYANFLDHWDNAGTLLMGGEARLPVSPWASLLVCALLTAGAVATLRARVKPVEVVA